MGTGQRILLGAITALIVCVGLYVLLLETRMITSMFDVVHNEMKDEEIYQQYYVQDVEEVSYAELVAILLHTLDYDIVIDGVAIRKDEHNSDKIFGYNLKINDYRKAYQYDEGGNITLITYTSKKEPII